MEVKVEIILDVKGNVDNDSLKYELKRLLSEFEFYNEEDDVIEANLKSLNIK